MNWGKAFSLPEPAHVIAAAPVADELLSRIQLHPLSGVGNDLLSRPARRLNASAKVLDLLVGDVDRERVNAFRGG
jgi:hypothetical protein